jgi:hypothetical protein
VTPVREVLNEMFGRPAPALFESLNQTPAEFQANLHEAFADLLHTVHSCERWQRTEDRIDDLVRSLGGIR